MPANLLQLWLRAVLKIILTVIYKDLEKKLRLFFRVVFLHKWKLIMQRFQIQASGEQTASHH